MAFYMYSMYNVYVYIFHDNSQYTELYVRCTLHMYLAAHYHYNYVHVCIVYMYVYNINPQYTELYV